MFCSKCDNLLHKITTDGTLKLGCLSCGSEFPVSPKDTLLISENDKPYETKKSGKVIFNYPSNQLSIDPCPKCKVKLTAWELDQQMNKIYGCNCGYSWTIISERKPID